MSALRRLAVVLAAGTRVVLAAPAAADRPPLIVEQIADLADDDFGEPFRRT